ncbi:putative premnaspirodiene oxygenase [Medicago truncatula]|nr:putative premnaspirodiene oxygenase [Medicago truncatula]
MTYNIISRATFGDKCNDQEAFILFIKECTRVVESVNIPNLFPSQHWLHVISGMVHKLKTMHRSGDMVLEKIINKAITKTSGDGSLLSCLLNLKDESSQTGFHLTTNICHHSVQDIIIGGSEPSTTTMEWAFSEMLKNPRILKRAQEEVRHAFVSRGYVDEKDLEELKFLKAVIKETFRLHPPNPLLLRECAETCEINGYTIPGGTHVLVNTWAIARDQKNWSDGDKFYPERFLDSPIDYKGSNFDFLPFGAGKRMCPGILFATPTIELPLAQLLFYFDWQLPFGISHENLDMTEAFGSVAKKKSELFVIPIPYNQ